MFEGRISRLVKGRLDSPPDYPYLIIRQRPGRIGSDPSLQYFVLVSTRWLWLLAIYTISSLGLLIWALAAHLGLPTVILPSLFGLAISPLIGTSFALRGWLREEEGKPQVQEVKSN